jgi:hypothetical protein
MTQDVNDGTPLDNCNDVEELKTIISQLWGILDDIDGACEFFSLNNVDNLNLFHKHVKSCAVSRLNILSYNGYELLIPSNNQEPKQ